VLQIAYKDQNKECYIYYVSDVALNGK